MEKAYFQKSYVENIVYNNPGAWGKTKKIYNENQIKNLPSEIKYIIKDGEFQFEVKYYLEGKSSWNPYELGESNQYCYYEDRSNIQLGIIFMPGGFTGNGAGKVVPTDPKDFNPKGLLKQEYNNGKIIKWHEVKLDGTKGKAMFEWNADPKYGDHFHITPDGKNRFTHPGTGDTHIWPGDTIPEKFLDFFK